MTLKCLEYHFAVSTTEDFGPSCKTQGWIPMLLMSTSYGVLFFFSVTFIFSLFDHQLNFTHLNLSCDIFDSIGPMYGPIEQLPAIIHPSRLADMFNKIERGRLGISFKMLFYFYISDCSLIL